MRYQEIPKKRGFMTSFYEDDDAMSLRPWMKFYPGDWRSDPALRRVSSAARGLWIDMLCIMHEAEPYGHLNVKGVPLTDKELAVMVGLGLKECRNLLLSLAQVGVSSTTSDGVVFSRRMVNDFAKALKDKENGKSGGNPSLNQGVNPPLKAQKLELELELESKPSIGAEGLSQASKAGPTTADLRDPIAQMVARLFAQFPAFAQQGANAGLLDTSPIMRLVVGEDCDLTVDIEVTIAGILARSKKPPRSWAYFASAIREAKAARIAARPGAPAVAAAPDGTRIPDADGIVRFEVDEYGYARRFTADAPEMERHWLNALRVWHSDGLWRRKVFGPAPGEAGCLMPESIPVIRARNVREAEEERARLRASLKASEDDLPWDHPETGRRLLERNARRLAAKTSTATH